MGGIMRLRNKKTGEIIILIDHIFDNYASLAELNDEWEDVPEEPKTFWAISWAGEPEEYDYKNTPEELKDMAKEIGNYFETKEEAEKVVERLRAWKRLKDKGFRFNEYDVAHNSNGDLCGQLFYNAGDYCIEDVEKDLDLLFCTEDD